MDAAVCIGHAYMEMPFNRKTHNIILVEQFIGPGILQVLVVKV
jgi:hypothetical protein